MDGSSQTARLGKEVVAYLLGPPHVTSATGKQKASNTAAAHAAVVPLNNPNPSTPLATLRGTVPSPSASSFEYVVSADSTSVLFLHADRERAVIHAHQYQTTAGATGTRTQTCTVLPLLHPPEPTPTLALSPRGMLLAAGSASGRLFVWHVPSGRLLASLDAHFRAVSCLVWTADETALVSGSDDSRILVWSTEAIINGSSEDGDGDSILSDRRAMPYAILTDHVQGISKLVLSSSKQASVAMFPTTLRIISASHDGTVKLWDARTRSLVATWVFAGPVVNVAADVGFRSFFAIVRARADAAEKTATMSTEAETDEADDAKQEYDWVRRVQLFGGGENSSQRETVESSTVVRITSQNSVVYRADAGVSITAIAISVTGSHLLLGTSEANMITIDVASSVTLRTTSLVVAGQTGLTKSGTSTSGLDVLGLSVFLVDDASTLLQSASMRSGGGVGGSARNAGWPVTKTLERSVQQQNGVNATIAVRLTNRDVSALVQGIAPPSLGGRPLRRTTGVTDANGNDRKSPRDPTIDVELRRALEKIAKLEQDNVKLKGMVKRSQEAYAGLMKHVPS